MDNMLLEKYRFKIVYKILIFTILISFVPMILLSILFYNKIAQAVKAEVVASYDHISEQYASNIEYKLALYENIMEEISSNALVQDFLLFLQQVDDPQEISKARVTILEEVNKYLSNKLITGLNSITLYPLGNKAVLYHEHLGNIKNLDNYQWIKSIIDSDSTYHFYSYYDWAKKQVISFYSVIRSGRKYANFNKIGLIRLDTYASNLFALTKPSVSKDNMKIVILDENTDILYDIGDLNISNENKKQIIESVYSNKQHVEISRNKYIVINRQISKYGWSILLLLEYNEISKKIYDGTLFTIIMTLVIYIILFIICLIFSSSMSRRLKILTDKMKKVKAGALVIEPTVGGSDEIAYIDKNFNDMVVKLNDMINQNYIQNIKKKEAELRTLRFQINPHFLYNTLELINSMASVYDCDDIGIVSQKLGQMIRYNISNINSDFATLYEEIEHIQNFYTIQKMRFGDNIKIIIDVPDELLEHEIPRFILQPIVENAFKHGFRSNKLEGTIKISARIIGQHLYVIIEDDGEGMEQERLEFVSSYINNEKINNGYIGENDARESIGLYNVNSRIKLCYGDDYGIQIESEKEIGTKIIIRIPSVQCRRLYND